MYSLLYGIFFSITVVHLFVYSYLKLENEQVHSEIVVACILPSRIAAKMAYTEYCWLASVSATDFPMELLTLIKLTAAFEQSASLKFKSIHFINL